jgi:uncharacterized membrane protein
VHGEKASVMSTIVDNVIATALNYGVAGIAVVCLYLVTKDTANQAKESSKRLADSIDKNTSVLSDLKTVITVLCSGDKK